MSAALRAHRRFDVLLAVLVPVLLYFHLLATGSSAVVPFVTLSPLVLAVALSLILPETLRGRLHLPGCLACTCNTTTRIAPFVVVGSR